jgi:hypothetical protein
VLDSQITTCNAVPIGTNSSVDNHTISIKESIKTGGKQSSRESTNYNVSNGAILGKKRNNTESASSIAAVLGKK